LPEYTPAMQKKFAVAVLAILVASFALADTVTITRDTKVHALPKPHSRVTGEIKAQTTVDMLGHRARNGFYHVKDSAKKIEGWIDKRNATVNKTAEKRTTRSILAPRPAPAAAAAAAAAAPAEAGDRAHTLAAFASRAQGHICEGVDDFESCHNTFPEGCTTNSSNDPTTYDAFLSYLKNLTPDPQSADNQVVKTFSSLDDFTALENSLRSLGVGKQKQADFANDLADLGQGNIDVVVGYVYYATPGGIETCNCKLKGQTDRDIHIGIGFDESMAEDIESGAKVVGADPDDAKQSSVIVEMTPHYRAEFHQGWTLSRVNAVVGKQVKITGQLLVDNEHNVKGQNCAISQPLGKCWRASVWEIHPVTRFRVCRNGRGCDPNSDADWDDLDNLVMQ
jgi:uncharacterized protein YgiM (DUF1202 family)